MPDLDRFSTAGRDSADMRTTRIALVAAALGIVACGGDKAPTATSCGQRWNDDANATQQATLAAATASSVLVGDTFRVGTWPNGEQKVPVISSTSWSGGRPLSVSARAAVVKKNSCVILLPDSTLGRMAFVQVDGKWGFVWGKKATFPAAAAKSISGARDAEPDALGKLKLHS
jgi:hypothetical protein